MARDHRKLRVFQDAHRLVVAVYNETRALPRDEWFGIRAQIRRAAVSVPSNIVEGSARLGDGEYLHFLNIARGSAGELRYLLLLAGELGYLRQAPAAELIRDCDALVPQLQALVTGVEQLVRATARGRKATKTL